MRRGVSDREALRIASARLREGAAIGVFLDGTRQSNGRVNFGDKSCQNVCEGYNDFDSRRFGYEKGSKKTQKVKMSTCGHSDGVGVNLPSTFVRKVRYRFNLNL